MLIEVDVPDAALAVYSDAAIRGALASVTFRPSPIQEQLGMLPFKVGELAGFRVVKVFPAGGVVMTEGPSDDVGEPALCDRSSIGRGAPEQADDRARFARDLLSTAPLRDLRLQSAEAMRIGGLPGYEIRAQAKGLNGEAVVAGAMGAFRRRQFFAHRRRRPQGRLGRAVHPLPRRARRDRAALSRGALEFDRAADAGCEGIAHRCIGIVRVGYIAAGVDDVLQVRLHDPPGRDLRLVAQLEHDFLVADRIRRPVERERIWSSAAASRLILA